MTIQTPTRITIEIHPPDPNAETLPEGGTPVMPIVRVVPEPISSSAPSVIAGSPREDVSTPAAFEPGPCLCLDDDDCAADHANE